MLFETFSPNRIRNVFCKQFKHTYSFPDSKRHLWVTLRSQSLLRAFCLQFPVVRFRTRIKPFRMIHVCWNRRLRWIAEVLSSLLVRFRWSSALLQNSQKEDLIYSAIQAHAYIHTRTYFHTYVRIYIYLYTYVDTYIHTCTFIHTCIYIYTHT
jgi:hypothetical protein